MPRKDPLELHLDLLYERSWQRLRGRKAHDVAVKLDLSLGQARVGSAVLRLGRLCDMAQHHCGLNEGQAQLLTASILRKLQQGALNAAIGKMVHDQWLEDQRRKDPELVFRLLSNGLTASTVLASALVQQGLWLELNTRKGRRRFLYALRKGLQDRHEYKEPPSKVGRRPLIIPDEQQRRTNAALLAQRLLPAVKDAKARPTIGERKNKLYEVTKETLPRCSRQECTALVDDLLTREPRKICKTLAAKVEKIAVVEFPTNRIGNTLLKEAKFPVRSESDLGAPRFRVHDLSLSLKS